MLMWSHVLASSNYDGGGIRTRTLETFQQRALPVELRHQVSRLRIFASPAFAVRALCLSAGTRCGKTRSSRLTS